MDFLSWDLLNILFLILFLLLSITCLVGHIFNLPGNFLILVLSILLGWYGGFQYINLKIIVILLIFALFGELLEFLVSFISAKKYKSSNRAIIVSIIFGIIGSIIFAPFLFGIGALLGAFIGVYLGALIVEYISGNTLRDSLWSARGIFLGKIGGTFSKIIVGIIMIVITFKTFI